MKIIRFIFALAITILLLFIPLFYIGYRYYENHYVYDIPQYILEDKLNNLDEPSSVFDLIDVLNKGNLRIKTDHLKILAERKDTIGFYASKRLAKSFADEFEKAEYYYKRALDLYPLAYTTRYDLAHLYERNENPAKAKEHYLKPLPQGGAIERLKNLGVERDEILKELFNLNALVEINEIYNTYINKKDKSHELSQSEIYSIKKYRSFSLFRRGEYEKALEYLEDLYSPDRFDEDVWYYYARCLQETGYGDEAKIKDIFANLDERAAYNLALILSSQGEPLKAARAYSLSNSNRSRWLGARLFEELGMKNDALDVYTKITQETSSYQDDAAYRAYVLANRMDENQENVTRYLDILKKQPAWMHRLEKEHVFPKLEDSQDKYLGAFELIKIYSQNNKQDLLSMEFEIQKEHGCENVKLQIAKHYLDVDDYYNAVIWAVRSYRQNPLREAYEIAYPKHFEPEVLQASNEFNVEPHLIWAIMREESHFRPSVISFAGAIGLMQIMPETGADIATSFNLNITDEDLKDPSINIRFGAYYINLMLNSHQGNLDKALAAYNGGTGNVNIWERSVLGNKNEDFPTAITFLETRNYITKVMNSYHKYNWLYKE